jgi:hypothetical protein
MSKPTIVLAAVLAGIIPHGLCPAQAPPPGAREALEKLTEAAERFDIEAFPEAAFQVLKGGSTGGIRSVVDAYARLAARAERELSPGEFLAVHGRTASAFRALEGKPAAVEARQLLRKHRQWQGRLLLLDAAAFSKKLDLEESCLAALEDAHPIVVRRALKYLAQAKKRPVAEAIVTRYLDLGAKRPRTATASEWDRALLAFRSTLTQLLGVDLPAPEDYRNYIAGRPKEEDLFKPTHDKGEISQLTLFGAAVSGKNIVFVLDTSGSMLTTDPSPVQEKRENQGRTVVAGGPSNEPTLPRVPEERRRMTRAKVELEKVVRALPEDVKFNMIFYASDVQSWKSSLVQASGKNKKAAVQLNEEAKADGITVTDMALEEAFADLGIDTVYLITDGAPTHIGSVGPAVPEDAPQLIAAIHERMKELNFLRGVRIFTLGFKEAEEKFLKKLAADNGGTYVAIE